MPRKLSTTSASTKKATSCATKSTTKLSKSNNNYKSNGITIKPATFSAGDKIKLTYTGLLSDCGAEEIFAHIGWGESWENLDDIKMSKTKSGFTATISVESTNELNLCFKDSMNNWDNNNGSNYTMYPSK